MNYRANLKISSYHICKLCPDKRYFKSKTQFSLTIQKKKYNRSKSDENRVKILWGDLTAVVESPRVDLNKHTGREIAFYEGGMRVLVGGAHTDYLNS